MSPQKIIIKNLIHRYKLKCSKLKEVLVQPQLKKSYKTARVSKERVEAQIEKTLVHMG